MDGVYDWATAPEYCNLESGYFRNLVRRGIGPVCVKPSPRKVLFRQSDLDTWMAAWVVKSNPQTKTAE
jgi:hypothetical protein